jgi:hypothetical protein
MGVFRALFVDSPETQIKSKRKTGRARKGGEFREFRGQATFEALNDPKTVIRSLYKCGATAYQVNPSRRNP